MRTDLDFWQTVAPEELFRQVAAEENRKFVVRVMQALTPDPVWTEPIIGIIESERIETRCFAAWLARELQPETYLEVGVRRGFSMAMVAARSPQVEIYGFDLWVPVTPVWTTSVLSSCNPNWKRSATAKKFTSSMAIATKLYCRSSVMKGSNSGIK